MHNARQGVAFALMRVVSSVNVVVIRILVEPMKSGKMICASHIVMIPVCQQCCQGGYPSLPPAVSLHKKYEIPFATGLFPVSVGAKTGVHPSLGTFPRFMIGIGGACLPSSTLLLYRGCSFFENLHSVKLQVNYYCTLVLRGTNRFFRLPRTALTEFDPTSRRPQSL